jgi:hypothetical protein
MTTRIFSVRLNSEEWAKLESFFIAWKIEGETYSDKFKNLLDILYKDLLESPSKETLINRLKQGVKSTFNIQPISEVWCPSTTSWVSVKKCEECKNKQHYQFTACQQLRQTEPQLFKPKGV